MRGYGWMSGYSVRIGSRLRWLVLLLMLLPAGFLAMRSLGGWGGLGTNPIEYLLAETGQWALLSLLVALAVTPVRRWTGWAPVMRWRRMLGLVAFAYATAHFLVWLLLDQYAVWQYLLEELLQRPFITVGFLAWLILLALALTSTTAAMRALGRHWVRLHRLVYVAALAGWLHVYWLTRADYREVVFYATILLVLLGARVYWAWCRHWQRTGRKRTEGAG